MWISIHYLPWGYSGAEEEGCGCIEFQITPTEVELDAALL